MRQLYIITGAKGHLASTIIRYLRKQDCEIRGLILPSETGEDDEQLTYYKGDVTKPETLDDAALKAACAWEFVSGLDGGLYAAVGERGRGLSEGQAQRISIARAVLRNAPILLLET